MTASRISPPRHEVRDSWPAGWEISGLAAAVALAALWLWVCWCLFPVSPWNDVRLAPSFALAHGVPVYPGENTGAVSTWIYGPLPVLLWWPATWAASAAGAVMTAGAINLVVSAGAIVAVCALWPAPAGRSLRPSRRVLAVVLAVALWPRAVFQFLQADNVAEILGLLSLLILMLSRSRRARWGAALLAVASLACKQTSIGVPAAEILGLGLIDGWKEAGRHAGRCLAGGLILAGLFVPWFGWSGLRLNMLGVPGHLPWVPDPARRLLAHLPALGIQLLVPSALMIGFRRAWFSRDSHMLLPCLAWIFSLPLGLAAMFTIGGNLNSLQGFVYWLPPALITGLAMLPGGRGTSPMVVGAALIGATVCAVRIWRIPSVSFRPLVEHYREADVLARSFPGQIWFPWNPLVTIYHEHRFYHVEDGMCMRLLSGHALTSAHLRRFLPHDLRVIALPRGGADWGLAVKLAPPSAKVTEFGLWTLHSWAPATGPAPSSTPPAQGAPPNHRETGHVQSVISKGARPKTFDSK